ncbi:MAG: PKD domain-containing protein [Flavobacteriales bacterium]|jgi:gliding motility-associated-like protein|nr:PKD domain-containing protein [Flavobacteriales bacterium]
MFKRFFAAILFIIVSQLAKAHSVQVVWCGSCGGELTLWVEHWHGRADPGTTTMTIRLTVNGVTTTTTGSPTDNQRTTINSLPNCSTAPTVVSACGKANTENDWVRYDFPGVPCGTPVEITVLSGNSAFTADGCGMYPASTGTITIPCPTPPQQLSDEEACANTTYTPTPFLNSNQPGVIYEWTNNNPNIGLPAAGTGDLPTMNIPPTTMTEVAVIDVVQGCDQMQYNITVNPQPVPSFSVTNSTNLNPTGAPLTTCLYDPIYFQNQSIIAAGNIQSTVWDFGETGATSTQQNPSHQYSTDGTFNVTLTTTSNEGCVKDTVMPVVVHPVPRAHLLESPVCQYDSVQFEDSSTINFPDYIDQTILDFGDGSPIVQDINPQHQYPSEGTYNISYIVISNNGCIDNTSTTTQIYSVPVANYTFTNVCENTEATAFYNASTVSTGSIMGWQWNFDEAVNSVSTLPNPQHDYDEAGIYNVRLVVNTENGCFDTIVQPVEVYAKPTAVFTSNITQACADACIDFYDVSLSNASSINFWEWTLDGGDTLYDQNPSKCYHNSSNTEDSLFTIGLVTRNDLGCYDSIEIVDYIAAWHNPIADFEVTPELTNMYLSNIEFPNNSIGADFYDWSFGDNRYSVDFEPNHTYRDTGTYQIELAVETIHGCKDTTYRSVRIDPVVSLYIPNTFTPNGDGENDDFFFKQYAMVEEGLDFKIFDKWGTLIYYTDIFKPWDGTYKGDPVKQDTYIYKITCFDFFGNEHNKKGHVNLLR